MYYRRSRSPSRSLGSYSTGLSFGGYNTNDLVNTYSPRNRSVQRVMNSDLGIHERSRSPIRDYSSPVSRATGVRPLPTLPPSPTLRRRDLSVLGSESRSSPIDWSTGDDYNFSVKPKSYYDFPSVSTTRYSSYSALGLKRPQRTDYSDYFRPLLTTKPMLKSGYVPRPRSERESAAEPIVRERKLIKFREITNDILSRAKRKMSWDIPDEVSSPLINDMKNALDATKENLNEPSRSRDSSLTKYGSMEAFNRDSSLTRYGSKEVLSRDCSLTRSKLPEESGSPKSVSRRSSSHSMDRLSPRNLMRLATSRIKDADPNSMEGQSKVVAPRKKSLGAIHKERKSRKPSLEGLTSSEERSINYSVIADQIRRSRESPEAKHRSPETPKPEPEPEGTPAVLEDSVESESQPATRSRCRIRTESPNEASRPINSMHRKSVKFKSEKPDNRILDAPCETLAADVQIDSTVKLQKNDMNLLKTEDVLKNNLKQSENSEESKKEINIIKNETPAVDKYSSDVKEPEKKLFKSSSGEKALKKASKTDKEKFSSVPKSETKTPKSSTGKLKLGSKTNTQVNSSTLLPDSSTQLEKERNETLAAVKPDLVEVKADSKESEEIVVVCKLPKKATAPEVKPPKPIPADQNVVVSIVKGSARSILVTDGEKAGKVLNIPTKLEAISENSNSSGGRKREERKEESSKKQAEVNVIHTVVLKGKAKEDSRKVEEVGNNNTRLKSIPDVIQSTINNIPLELNENNTAPMSPKSDKVQLLPIKKSSSSDSNAASLSVATQDKTKKEKVAKPLSIPKLSHTETNQAEMTPDIPTLNNKSSISSKPDVVQSQNIADVSKTNLGTTKEKDSSNNSAINELKFSDPNNLKTESTEKSLEKTSRFRINAQLNSKQSIEKTKPYKKSVTVPNVDVGINYKSDATSFSSDNIPVSSVEKNLNMKGKTVAKVESVDSNLKEGPPDSTKLPQIFSPKQKLDAHLSTPDSMSKLPVIGTLPESKPDDSKDNVSKVELSSDQKLEKISITKQKASKTNELVERLRKGDDLTPKENDNLNTKPGKVINLKEEKSTLLNLQKIDSKAKEIELKSCIDEKKQKTNAASISKVDKSNTLAEPLKSSKVAAIDSLQNTLPDKINTEVVTSKLPDLVLKSETSEKLEPISKTKKLEETSSNTVELLSTTKKFEEKLSNTKLVSKIKSDLKLADVSKSKLDSTEPTNKTNKIEETSKSNKLVSEDGILSTTSEPVSKKKTEDVPKLNESVLKTKVEATPKVTEPDSKKTSSKTNKIEETSKSNKPVSKDGILSSTSEPVSKKKTEDVPKLNESVLKTKFEATSKVTEPASKTNKIEETSKSNKLVSNDGLLSTSSEPVSKKKTEDIPKLNESVLKTKFEATPKVTEPDSKTNKFEETSKSNKLVSKDGILSSTSEPVSKKKTEDVPKLNESVLKTKFESTSKATEPTSQKNKIEETSKSNKLVSKDGILSSTSEPVSKKKTEDVPKLNESVLKTKFESTSKVTEPASKTNKIEETSKSNKLIPNDGLLSTTSEPVSKKKTDDVPKLNESVLKTKLEGTSKVTDTTANIKQVEDGKPTQPIPKVKNLEETIPKSEPASVTKKDTILKIIEPVSKTKNSEALEEATELDSKKKKLEKSLPSIAENVSKTDIVTSKSIPSIKEETVFPKNIEPCLKTKKGDDMSKQLEITSKTKKLESLASKDIKDEQTKMGDPAIKPLEPVSRTKKLEPAISKTKESNLGEKKLESLPKQDGNVSCSIKANSEPKKLDKLVQKTVDPVPKIKNLEDAPETPKQLSNSKVSQDETTSKTKETRIQSKILESTVLNKTQEKVTSESTEPKTLDKKMSKEISSPQPHTNNVLPPKEPLLKDAKRKDESKMIEPQSNGSKIESSELSKPPDASKSKSLAEAILKSEPVSKDAVKEPKSMPLNASRPCPAPETILETKKSAVPDLLNHVRSESEISKPSRLDNEKLKLPTVAENPPVSPKQEKKPPPASRGYGLRFRYNQQQRSSYSSDSDSSSEDESTSDSSCDEDRNKDTERRSFSSPEPLVTPLRSQRSRVGSTLSNQTTITTLSSVEDSPVKPRDPCKKLRFRKYDIDDFVFLKLLGKGSFGKVLLAELKGHDMYFAIKCLRKDVVLEDDDVESTMIERRVLALGTQHPYMCKLYCTFQTKSYLFFVMEYLNGGDLMFHIQESRPFDVKRAMFYGAEIVSALKFLHKRGIVYRDIKLDNVMLDADGHVRLVDFGMCQCRIYREECMPYNFCGTPNYIAPEIILGQKYNQSVDWWSLGVLLFEMLAGRSPFVGTDEDELFWCICNEEPFYPRFLSKESKDILENLLVKYPNKRLGMPSCPGEIQDHPFFSTIDWEKLEKKQIPPPFKPTVLSAHDTNNFDSSFTLDSPTLSPVDPEILASMDQEQFQGFSYTNPHTTG